MQWLTSGQWGCPLENDPKFKCQSQIAIKKKDNSDMAKFGYNGNTIRIQRNVYFISGNMQGK